jgi:hypothetical protein
MHADHQRIRGLTALDNLEANIFVVATREAGI